MEALVAQGDTHARRFENRAAVEAYERALALGGDDFAVLERLSRAHHDYGLDLASEKKRRAEAELETAAQHATTLQELYPDRAASHFLLAAARGSLARFVGGRRKVEIGHQVEALCRRALELDAGYAISHAVLGVYYREVADLNWLQRTAAKLLYGGAPKATWEDAVESLTQALELDPELAFAHFELAVTYDAMGRRDEAVAHLRRVIQGPPQTSQDVRNQARARELLDKWEK